MESAETQASPVQQGWTTVPCPLCGNCDRQLLRTIRCSLFGTDATAGLARCNHCGLVRTDPQPRGETLTSYYATDAYYTHSRVDGPLKRMTRRWALGGPLAALRLWVEEHTGISRYTMRFAPKSFGPWYGRLLDYGCGDGNVAATFAAIGLQVVGVEPDAQARMIAGSRGVEVFASLEECPAGDFDRIIVRHVLEHVDDPLTTLRRLAGRLVRDDGRMLISVPNAMSYQAAVFDEHWIGWDIPRHLWHFSPDTLASLVRQAGLSIDYCGTVELRSFASASAQRYEQARRSRPNYAPRSVTAIEAANQGTEIVLVARPA